MLKKPWGEELQNEEPVINEGVYDQAAFRAAGVIEGALGKGGFEMGKMGKRVFQGEGEVGEPSKLEMYKIPKLDDDKQENYRLLSEVLEGDVLCNGERFSKIGKKEQKEILRYIKNVLVWSANYMLKHYEIGLPKTLCQDLEATADSWGSFVNFVQYAQKYSSNARSGFLVCRLLKIAGAYHEVTSNLDVERVQHETQFMGRYMAQHIPVLEKKEESWSADGLEKETGLYVKEGTVEEKSNKKKKDMLELERIKSSTSRETKKSRKKGKSLNVSFDDDKGGHDFQILAVYFNTKEIDRMVGKRLRKPGAPLEEVLNDGARGRMLVRKSTMQDAVAWFESMNFMMKGSRTTVVERPEIVMAAQRLEDEFKL